MSRKCHDTNCCLCNIGFSCKAGHHVYSFGCNFCNKSTTITNEQLYNGASRRRPIRRLKEHEASTRLWNKRSALGIHMINNHPDLQPTTEQLKNLKGKVDFGTFLTRFTPSILYHGKDTLDVFINEGLYIRDNKPKMNNNLSNGFVFT